MSLNSNLSERALGEAWQVHGGCLYRIMQYLIAPRGILLDDTDDIRATLAYRT
jgi:uncharacterized membrane protein